MDGSPMSVRSLLADALAQALPVSDAPSFEQVAAESHVLARRVESLLSAWESKDGADGYRVQVTRALFVSFLESLTDLGRTR